MAADLKVGDRRAYDGVVCTIRYIGEVAGTSGSWLGVEWDDPGRGKHDGSHKGVRYFTCSSQSPTAASFVRPTRPAEAPRSFIQALQEKYTAELSHASAIQFSGKVAEEVGFEKIRRKQAQLEELKYVVLDGMCITSVRKDGEPPIAETCPKVVELDLSRNLFQSLEVVVDICSELPNLRSLRLNGNRFQDVLNDHALDRAGKAFGNIKDLALEETLLSWQEICRISTKFQSLAGLSASTNQLASLPPMPYATLSSTLTSLHLEFNNFTSLADIGSLVELKSLRNLHLKGNSISTITDDASSDKLPIFPRSVQYLDVSYNQVSSWEFADELPSCFPGLVSLRFAHNPIYDNPDPEFTTNAKNITEEAYMLTVARLANLKSLNFGTISQLDRQNAEMFYLARIGKHLASVPESKEADIIKQHRRYAELCELYGPPTVNRRSEINPAFLEARLISVHFLFHPAAEPVVEKATRIPKSFDIYAVKGIAGKLFGVRPLGLRLTWETGEWDPVAGFDDEVEDSSEEDETPPATEVAPSEEVSASESKAGKWVKREVELQDGPRQLGFCIDGLDARVRVELR
ncbi:RNI-like protein [Xylariomycetidae sp. FL0641]|nr:RNI-like protein [Xylariomycetidae sp. FL0641]